MNAGQRLDQLEQAATRLDRALDQLSLQQLAQLREFWHGGAADRTETCRIGGRLAMPAEHRAKLSR